MSAGTCAACGLEKAEDGHCSGCRAAVQQARAAVDAPDRCAQRWSDETETFVADAFRRCDSAYLGGQPDGYHRSNARAVLKYLADQGLLVEPGGETREEWSAEPSLTPRYVTGPIESDREIVCPMREPEQAMRDYLRGIRGRPALVRRTVHTGPWRAAQ